MRTTFKDEFNKRFDQCGTKFERIVLTSGALLGVLARITGEPFDYERLEPSTWPKLLADAIARVSQMTARSKPLNAWLEEAKKIIVAMHQASTIFAPN